MIKNLETSWNFSTFIAIGRAVLNFTVNYQYFHQFEKGATELVFT